MEPIEKKSISEKIASALRRRILSGELTAGSRLPSEPELAQQFGTNRNTLREAIRVLEEQSLLQVRHGGGVTVRDFRQVGELSLLPAFLLEGRDPTLQRDAIADLLALRRLVLVEAAAAAARRADPEAVAALRERLAAVAACEGRTRELIAADLAFYKQLVVAARSLLYVWVFNTFERVYRSAMPLLERFWVVPEGYLGHLTALVEAIGKGDEAAARRILGEHFASGDTLALAPFGAEAVNREDNEEGERR